MRIKDIFRDNNAPTARIALWYTFSNVLVRGIAFITTPIFTRLLSKTEYGAFSNFTSWESILAVVITLDLTASIERAKYDYNERMDSFISTIVLTSNITTLIAYIIVELNHVHFENWFNMDMTYIRLMFLYIMFITSFTYLQTRHRIYRKYKFFVTFALFSTVLRTSTAIALVLVMNDKLLGRVLGYVIPITMMNVLLWITIIRKGKGKRFDWDCAKYALTISVPLIPHALSVILLGSSDRIMITKYCGTEATAMYTLAYQVSLLTTIIWKSMNQAWAPWLYDNIHADNRKAIDKNSKIYLGVFAIMVIGLFLFTPEAMLILGGQKYFEARFVMPPVIMGCAFQFIYGMYVNIEIYRKKTFLISVGTISAALLNIGLNMIYIPRYGYIAAAYTTLVGYFALLVFHYTIVRKIIPQYSNLYNGRFIIMTIVVLLGVGALSPVLYMYNYIRYSVSAIYVLAVLFGCYKYRYTLLRLLGNRKKA